MKVLEESRKEDGWEGLGGKVRLETLLSMSNPKERETVAKVLKRIAISQYGDYLTAAKLRDIESR